MRESVRLQWRMAKNERISETTNGGWQRMRESVRLQWRMAKNERISETTMEDGKE